jgi:ADP-ribosylglycohydrolase
MIEDQRLSAARTALEGLSVGDAVGRNPTLVGSSWRYSDDTEMAIAIFEVLREHHAIDQEALASAFARRFERDPERGYGAMAYWLLHQIVQGRDWRSVSREVFQGRGSLGNGAAMRVAPVGAHFSGDLPETVRQAQLSAAITHAHPDGQAGAIAVAVAACACTVKSVAPADVGRMMFEAVLEHTPDGPTRDGIVNAASLEDAEPPAAARILGDGTLIRASDTVPLALWCAAKHMHSYEGALCAALSACEKPTADRDTVCAIVGSIVVLSAGVDSIPVYWRDAREALDV